MDTSHRLAFLESLESLTDLEMQELIDLKQGAFKKLPNLFNIGIVDPDKFISNLKEGEVKSNTAYENGFYIETISLRLQHIEIFLRMFYVSRKGDGTVIDAETDKRTFGRYVSDCESLDFNETLISELKDFNKGRIEAIHKYLLGTTNYEDLKEICVQTKGLDERVREYVFNEIGIPIN